MKQNKSLQVSLLFVVVLFWLWGCSDDVAGVTEDGNTMAEKNSSSSSIALESSSSIVPVACRAVTPKFTFDADGIPSTIEPLETDDFRTSEYREVDVNLVYSLIGARIRYLEENGFAENLDSSLAYSELYKAAGLDSLFADTLLFWKYGSVDTVYGSSLIGYSLKPLAYVFDEMDSLEFLEVQKVFAETGTMDRSLFCGIFDQNTFYGNMVQETTHFVEVVGCAWGGIEYDMPAHILKNFWRKCLDMPYCGESHRLEFMIAGRPDFGIADAEYVCQFSGWEIPGELDQNARNHKCTSDNLGDFIKIPSRSEGYYICRESGWSLDTMLEMGSVGEACDEEGKRLTGTMDEDIVYSCRNGEWVEF